MRLYMLKYKILTVIKRIRGTLFERCKIHNCRNGWPLTKKLTSKFGEGMVRDGFTVNDIYGNEIKCTVITIYFASRTSCE